MPAKAKKAAPTKKVAPARKAVPVKKVAQSRVAPRRVVARPAARPVASRATRTSQESIWTKHYFKDEQDDFFARHPNAKILLAMFIAALVFYMAIVWTNRADLFPQLFML